MSGHVYVIEIDDQPVSKEYRTLQGARRAARRLVKSGQRAAIVGYAGDNRWVYLTEAVRCGSRYLPFPRQVLCDMDAGHLGQQHYNGYYNRSWSDPS